MRILADANMHESVVDLLRDGGHEVVWVKEEQPRALDPDVLAWATRERRLLITYDKDFGEITHLDGNRAPARGHLIPHQRRCTTKRGRYTDCP